MICGFISSILFAILAALYRAGNTHLYLCIGVTCMAFIFVRFNLVALRNDKTDRLFVVNNGAVLVLFVSGCLLYPCDSWEDSQPGWILPLVRLRAYMP